MQKLNLKQLVLLLGLLLPAVWCGANSTNLMDGLSHILIMEGNTHNTPKGSSIQATIEGHYLTVVFTENLGQVAIEINTSTGGYVETLSITTPNGLQFYIPNTGDYIVNFTLPNADEYYGEFTVEE
jgi:hypothetical protein